MTQVPLPSPSPEPSGLLADLWFRGPCTALGSIAGRPHGLETSEYGAKHLLVVRWLRVKDLEGTCDQRFLELQP